METIKLEDLQNLSNLFGQAVFVFNDNILVIGNYQFGEHDIVIRNAKSIGYVLTEDVQLKNVSDLVQRQTILQQKINNLPEIDINVSLKYQYYIILPN